ncbi:MAG: TetR/AcrR family transcriptional regulator [Beijerinckiaceae bacterium]|nr:MAG: TetR/AcrR family transcriptional regulator [Beijerinckiaceae bacterium]
MPPRGRDRAEVLSELAEVFRDHGFDGASLAVISEKTGLGRGSLYNLFPDGKEEMVAAVLAEIDLWFETQVFAPLRDERDARQSIGNMLRAVDDYFRSGRRLCLVGVLALGDSRDRFAQQVHAYFVAWTEALAAAIVRTGTDRETASALAEEAVAVIQGALILARAMPESGSFGRTLTRLQSRLLSAPSAHYART